jgi:uncharacterized delta-60 repeat protein
MCLPLSKMNSRPLLLLVARAVGFSGLLKSSAFTIIPAFGSQSTGLLRLAGDSHHKRTQTQAEIMNERREYLDVHSISRTRVHSTSLRLPARTWLAATITASLLVLTTTVYADPPVNGQPDWVEQGPGPATVSGSYGYTQVSGAVQAIAADPTNPDRVFVGAANGGIWRTLNATASSPAWTPVSDHAASLSIGSLVFSPLDASHNTLFAGVTETSHSAPLRGNRHGPLAGILKTIDGGNNWSVVGQDTFSGYFVQRVLPTPINTANGQVIFVLAYSADGCCGGLYRSVNGGLTWDLRSGLGGLPDDPFSGVADVVEDPGNLDRLFAASVNPPKLFRSEDRGLTWTDLTSGVGFPANFYVAPQLAISPTASGGTHWLYLLFYGSGIYVSSDFGGTWRHLDNPTDGSQFGGEMVVSPNNANIIFASTDKVSFWRGDAGAAPGSQWFELSPANSGGTDPHTDGRAFVFSADPNVMFEGDDGGIYRLKNPFSNTPRWDSAIGDLRVTEFHSIAYDHVNHVVFGACQDNSIPQQTVPGNIAWGINEDFYGDGMQAGVDNTSIPGTSVHYSSQQNLFRARRRTYTSPTTVGSDVPWQLIINGTSGLHYNQLEGDININDPNDLGTVRWNQSWAVNIVNGQRLLLGTDYLYESSDRGDHFTSLGGIGQNSLGQPIPLNPVGTVTAYAYGHPQNADTFYVGTLGNVGGHLLWLRVNGTGYPTALDTFQAAGGSVPWGIAVDPNDWRRAYVLDQLGRVWRTSDAGATVGGWVNLTGAPGNNDSLSSLSTDLRAIELYAPTAVSGQEVMLVAGVGGVFATRNPNAASGVVWTKYGPNFANAIVTDLHYDPTDDVLVAGTLGRGAWALPKASETLLGGRAGTLDPALDENGRSTYDFGLGAMDAGRGVAIQPDGKIIVAGTAGGPHLSTGEDFGLVRFNGDGITLDSAFNFGSGVRTDFGADDNEEVAAVALQPDGKIVVVGTDYQNFIDLTSPTFAIARYKTDGSLDASFNPGGTVPGTKIVRFPGDFVNSWASAVAIRPNGRILVVGTVQGSTTGTDFALAQLNPDGSLDTSFGPNHTGMVETDFSAGDDAALAVALQSDGKAVVVGAADTVGSSNFGYIRYNEDGSIEGVATYDFNGKRDQATGVAVLPGGKMILGGFAQSVAGDFDFALLRLNPSGTLDASFGNNGKVTADFGGGSADYAQAVAVQSDGKIVLVGSTTCCNFGPSEFGAARFNPDGTPDDAFGPYGNGLALCNFLTPAFQASSAYAASIDGDGRILAAGTATIGTDDFALTRWCPGEYPVLGTPWPIPGTIRAEDYDNGGPGIAYSDTTVNVNEAGGVYQSLYRPGSGVDLETDGTANGPAHVAYIRAGEWLQYTVNAQVPGLYRVYANVASSGSGGTFHIELDGVNVTGTMVVPDTGGYLNFMCVDHLVSIPAAGTHLVKVAFDQAGANGAFVGNMDYIHFCLQANPNLAIRLVGNQLVLSWPTTDPGFQLQSNNTIDGGSAWQDVTTPEETIGGEYRITLPAASSPQFFRLVCSCASK